MKISIFKGILLGVFVIAAFIGLFVFATYTNKSTGGDSVGTVVIWGTLSGEALQSVLTILTQTNPILKNVSYQEKDAASLASDLAAAIATGGAPDLVLASQEELRSLAKFITPIPLATLPARTFTDTFISEGDLFGVPGGGYYGIPFLVDPLVLFTNRPILASSGIAQPPSTWESLVGLVPRVVQSTPSRQISRGLIALGTYDNVHNARGILSTLFLQTGVPVSGYSATGVLAANLGGSSDSSSGQAALGFYTQFTDQSKVSYTWNASLPDSQQAFLAGDLALYLGYASEARYLRSANPNLDMTAVPVPQPATANIKSVYGLLYAFMIPRGAANPSGAYRVAATFTNATEQITAAGATGLAPASLAVLSQAPADPVAAVAYAEALYAKGWLSPAPSATDPVFSGMIGNVISGRMNLVAALANAERSLSALLQQ
jgi:ABC-type glycerol-3-phosphate transport system substrate-binding protein